MRTRLGIGAPDLAAWEAWFAIIILSIHSRPSSTVRTERFAIAAQTDGTGGPEPRTPAPALSG